MGINPNVEKSYCCGAINLLGWIATAAGFVITTAQLITGLATFMHPTYTIEAWHVFLIFQLMNVIFILYNMFLIKRTLWIHDVGCKYSYSPCKRPTDPSQLSSLLSASSLSSLPVSLEASLSSPMILSGGTLSTLLAGRQTELSSSLGCPIPTSSTLVLTVPSTSPRNALMLRERCQRPSCRRSS